MSAVSNLTYVWFQDASASAPDKESTPVAFSNYNEAMSFAKWAVSSSYMGSIYVTIWNYNGGSGVWNSGVFTPIANANWP